MDKSPIHRTEEYRKIRFANKDNEIRGLSILVEEKNARIFAISKDVYLITHTQCDTLRSFGVDYKNLDVANESVGP